MKGRVHSIQSMGAVDGPGLRYVVFLQGCPLRCGYCHNPDTWAAQGGAEYTPQELFAKLRRFTPYFGTEGGVTVSGGEALLQPDFVEELFTLCREAGIHTVLDTSGYRLDAAVHRVLDVTDMVLLDIKMTTDEDYRRYVGCSLQQPLDFLQELQRRGIPTWIRQVIVTGFNDNEENILRLRKLLAPYDNITRVELLPFHKLCRPKYEAMGIDFPFERYAETSHDTVERLYSLLTAPAE